VRNPTALARAFVLARWTAWFRRVKQEYVLPTIAHAEQMAQRKSFSPEQQAQIQKMIVILRQVAKVFGTPLTDRRMETFERARQNFWMACHNLALWDNDAGAAAIWAKTLVGDDQERHWLLAEVSTLPLLEGKQNWTTKDRPVFYARRAVHNMCIDAYRQQQPDPRVVPIEDAPELVAPEPAIDHEEVIRTVLTGADAEVKDYGTLILRGMTQAQAQRQLGWAKKRTHRVDVRYRLHLKRAAKTHDLQTLRSVLAEWRSNASKTVVRRTFNDDDEGRQHQYFDHRGDWKEDPKSKKA
jgi:hypothetical protein